MESYWLFSDFYSKSCNIFFFCVDRSNFCCCCCRSFEIDLNGFVCNNSLRSILLCALCMYAPTTANNNLPIPNRCRHCLVLCSFFFLLLLLLENSAHELVRERSHLRPRSSFPSCARFTAHLHTFNYNFISFLPFISWLNRHEERIIPCLNMSFHWIAADILLFVLIKRMKEIKKQRKRIKTGKYSLCLCLMPYDMVHS